MGPITRWVRVALAAVSILCALAPTTTFALATAVHSSHCLTGSHHDKTASPESGHAEPQDEASAFDRAPERAADAQRGDALECCDQMCPLAILMAGFELVIRSVSAQPRGHSLDLTSPRAGRLHRPPISTLSV